MEIQISDKALKQIDKTLIYLEEEWSHQVAENFYNKLLDAFSIISAYPQIGKESQSKKSVRIFRITKHNTLYYSISKKYIRVLFIWDTRKKSYKR